MRMARIRPRTLMPRKPICPSIQSEAFMPDIIWLAILGGLFLATLAFVRLCDKA